MTGFIKDQRHITGPGTHASVADIEAVWEKWGAQRLEEWGTRRVPADADTTLTAYVSANRWVADCPNCGAGIACWAANPRACCLGCGLVYTINMPADWLEAEKALLERPKRNRHWLPGETLLQLQAENIAQSNLPGWVIAPLNNPDLAPKGRR